MDTVRPRWRLLQQHLDATRPGWSSVAEREERLFTNRSNQPGDDMKDEVRTDDDWHAWRIWSKLMELFRASMIRSGNRSCLAHPTYHSCCGRQPSSHFLQLQAPVVSRSTLPFAQYQPLHGSRYAGTARKLA